MRKIRQVLRLSFEHAASRRHIAGSLGMSRDAVTDTLTRAAAAGLSWPLPADMDDAELEQRLFPASAVKTARKPQPDWAQIHQELKKKWATLQGLHEEYLAEYPDGMGRSHFCQCYREWAKGLKRYLRQTYQAGERVFVDYAGLTLPIHSQAGEVAFQAQIFVGVLGASSYTYAEAHASQRLPDWISAHVRMFEFFGGVPEVIVCDNLKSAVTKASRTEPVINQTYQHLAEHYGSMIVPARPRKPKDKAKAEGGVQVVERWILFRLRHHVFTGLEDANAAIRVLLDELNSRPFQKLPGSRLSTFETVDKPELKDIPVQPFEYTEFRRTRVGLDGRFLVGEREYSAPYWLCKKEIDLRITASTVEILYKGRRAASHQIAMGGEPVIDPQHLSPNDRHYAFWEASNELVWARSIGESVHDFLRTLLSNARVKEQGYRTANAMKKLASEFGDSRLNLACSRAIAIGASSLSNVRSILRNGLDLVPDNEDTHQEAAFDHINVRGSHYYH